MGATIFPAEYVETKWEGEWRWHLASVIDPEDFTVDDPDYGRVNIGNPWEMHLTYGSTARVFSTLCYGIDRDQYSGEYPISDVCGRLEALMESDQWGYVDDTVARHLEGLLRCCFYGLRNGATHIAWS